ncbi:hypothetical protein JHD46_07320 [Sulfurimonas sp. SAG-AH-194-C20]|nr:hypothetical protein [Sulfurimonas sp. SAG-AH-194-C20]MDF1879444.1 hypothetical protein [Sulfurimonas sp. SAG-AH-194-C20]
MKTSALIFATLLATSPLYCADTSSYEVEFSNAKVNYIDVPKLNLQLRPQEKSSFEFILGYASSLFSNTKEQDSGQKQHSMHIALNYEF